jgi:hypothetical protein
MNLCVFIKLRVEMYQTIFKKLVFLILILASACNFIHAEEFPVAPQTSNYLRLLKDENSSEPIALETSIEHLIGKDSRGAFSIDLVSAVHIAESSYYQNLNKRFLSYDSVLFELIADSSIDDSQNREQIGQPSDHPLSLAQKALQALLGLNFQLEEVNYKAKNFVHADMSPEQFTESMQQRGESVSQMLLKVMLQSMATSGERPPPDLSDLIMLGFPQHRTIGLRRSLARQFGDMETMMTAINGDEGSTIISERNRVAVSVAKSELHSGKRSLAIFYGGAHMPDMKKQLIKALGVESKNLEWLSAWNLTVKAVEK